MNKNFKFGEFCEKNNLFENSNEVIFGNGAIATRIFLGQHVTHLTHYSDPSSDELYEFIPKVIIFDNLEYLLFFCIDDNRDLCLNYLNDVEVFNLFEDDIYSENQELKEVLQQAIIKLKKMKLL